MYLSERGEGLEEVGGSGGGKGCGKGTVLVVELFEL